MRGRRAHCRPGAAGQRGFTLIETVVTLAVMVVLLLATLDLFDLAARVARAQTAIADVQQSSRAAEAEIVRLVRMAGRGGLPAQAPAAGGASPGFGLPGGLAIAVADDVGEDTFIDAPGRAHQVLAGTDVLTVRGVLDGPVYVVLPSSFRVDRTPGSPGRGTGELRLAAEARPGVPVPQDLAPLVDAIQARRPEALLLVAAQDPTIYQVVELDPSRCLIDDARHPAAVTVAFRLAGGEHTDAYAALSGGEWRDELTDVAYAGLLSEYRFYVEDPRRGTAVESGASGTPRPRLLRAQVYPGTQVPHAGTASWAVPQADDIADLQVALGVEGGLGSTFEVDEGVGEVARAADEWLFNSAGDDATLERWRTGRLAALRLTITGVSPRPDHAYRGPATIVSEDHHLAIPEPGDDGGGVPDRRFRRRTLQSVVAPRSLR